PPGTWLSGERPRHRRRAGARDRCRPRQGTARRPGRPGAVHQGLQTAQRWDRPRRNPSRLTCSGVSIVADSVRRPHVRMLLHGAFRGFAGGARDVTLDAMTLGEALQALVRAHPTLAERLRDERGTLRPHLALFINQDDARLLGWEDAPLHEGDIVHVIPALSGG